MQSLWRLTIFLCCLWAVTVIYGEMVAYWVPRWTCSWPQPQNPMNANDQVKVAVIADPQLMDRYSLGLSPKSSVLEAVQFYTDLYMRRSFHMSILPFKPDLVVFLGDHFDGGPVLSDEEWKESLSRFRHIFGLNEMGRLADIPAFYLSGNHDIGYAQIHTRYPKVIRRYEQEFGARNYHFSAGNISFIVVDAQTLDGPTEGTQTTASWDFIKNVSRDVTLNPKVLLTHIPLYRRDATPCGQYRSAGIINQRVSHAGDQGIIYQNYLTEETSALLLDLIKPILVLSGHDHDQCTVTHSASFGTVTEHTLGTISWQQGNLYPSFMLLTAMSQPSSNVSDSGDTVSTQLCFLPMQTHIYIWYLSQFVLTLILLATWPKNGFGCTKRLTSLLSAIGSDPTTTYKEKDDEDCEYEMIWDAQGSMHLVKKAAVKVPIPKTDAGLAGRGNVVARSAAKKHIVQEAEEALSLELGGDVKSDNSKVSRASKSKARMLIQRLIRVFQLLVVITAVNFPIYMMLLFKDWIDR